VIWLGADGIDPETAEELAAAGVDELVIRRGSVTFSGFAPLIQLHPATVVGGPIPTAVALEVVSETSRIGKNAANAVWNALAADFKTDVPAELILDFRDLPNGVEDFVARMAHRSGLAVTPVLTISQLETKAGRAVARAAHGCIVPAFGTDTGDLRGTWEQQRQPLATKLEAFQDLGVRLRVGIALRPEVEPETGGWAEDINALTDESNAQIKRTSQLDRTFTVRRPLTWSGRSWAPGKTIAVRWIDFSKIRSFLSEVHRLSLPEISGWDFVELPPAGPQLGSTRDELVEFLKGNGPEPDVEVRLRRNGRNLRVETVNRSVFRSAVTTVGNWVQVELASGTMVASSRGTFDRIVLGTVAQGEWQANPVGRADALRFHEIYVAPGEALETGSIRLPSSRSRIVVRWNVQLSDGSTVGGVAR
jgi:hypothetical protein